MNTRTLDSNYFELLSRRDEGEYQYQAYRVHVPASTIVLFSVDDAQKACTPVAALSFFLRDREDDAQTVLTRRSVPPPQTKIENGYASFFQGLTNFNNEEISFVIHNLTDFVSLPGVDVHHTHATDLGYIKIDILGTPVDVREVNMPTLGINQVNELGPSQSYLIECDQRNNNRTMVLRGIVNEATGAPVTVEDDEKKEKPKANRFFINVTASAAFPDLVALLRKTVWRPVDVFVRRVPRLNGTSQLRPKGIQFAGGGGVALYGQLQCAGGGQARPLNPFLFSTAQPDNDRLSLSSARGTTRTASVAGLAKGPAEKAKPFSFGSPAAVVAEPAAAEIQASQAGEIVQGTNTVTVHSNETDVVYDYDTHGERICLTLSVWREMRLFPALSLDECKEEAKMQTDEVVKKETSKLYQELTAVFKEDECVVCCENTPEIVFFRCGHQCICNQCVDGENKRCYVCRAPLLARLTVEQVPN